MRTKGTKYQSIEQLPANALPVRKYAEQEGLSVPHVYVKYARFTNGYPKTGNKGVNPGYSIVCWQGMNWVIPN